MGLSIIDRVLIEEIKGRIDTIQNVWYIPKRSF